MNDSTPNKPSRREFLRQTGRIAAASALAGVVVPAVHAGEDNTIQLALIGCGGRGTGAAANALATKSGPIKLVAMADVFPNRLQSSLENLKRVGADSGNGSPDTRTAGFSATQIDVPAERQFIGFDAYRQAMDCLRPGDVAILTTPCAFRGVHFRYAIEKGIHVFMEKPTTVDGPSTREMLALADASAAKNLKVGVGLMCRHCEARHALIQRIQDGAIGDITMLRTYRLVPPAGFTGPKPADMSELLYQIQRYLSFFWASGGLVHDYTSHNIDECCWMKGSWPVRAQGQGGRYYPGDAVDQNVDHYNVEYTFADGAKLFVQARNMPGCYGEFASYAHGTRGAAVISTYMHTPAKCRISKNQSFADADIVWAFPQPEPNPYQLEWDHLVEAIRQDKPFNEARRGAEASLVQIMGRRAVNIGQVVTWDEALNDTHAFATDLDKLTMDSPAPVQANADGQYPFPQPGFLADREY